MDGAEQGGFAADLSELESIARAIGAVSDAVRAGWRADRMDEDTWPADDELTRAVLRYRRSLAAAAERLCDQTEGFGEDLGVAARAYREVDASAAEQLRRAAGDG